MFNAVRKFWKRRVRVTLKRPNEPGMTYREVIDLLDNLNYRRMCEGHYVVKIDAMDLRMLLKAHAVRVAEDVTSEVKTTEGYTPKMVAMWGDEQGLGMQEWLEIVPISGLNEAAIYRFDRCVRTGQ